MAKTMQITISIKDENGEAIIEKTSERSVPYIKEIEEQGFRDAFHDLETAVLESRKEVSESAISEYLEIISKKSRNRIILWGYNKHKTIRDHQRTGRNKHNVAYDRKQRQKSI